jgi:hypothetical protein
MEAGSAGQIIWVIAVTVDTRENGTLLTMADDCHPVLEIQALQMVTAAMVATATGTVVETDLTMEVEIPVA